MEMRLYELPVELRSNIYYLSDSQALLLTCKAFGLRCVWPELQCRLPPCARERALLAYRQETLRWLSAAALEDILSDDHLNADEADVAHSFARKASHCVRWELLQGSGSRMPRIGPGVRRWPFLEPTHIPRVQEDRVGLSYLACANDDRTVYGALLGGGLVQWDVQALCEVRRFAPHVVACSLEVVHHDQQLAVGLLRGHIALYDLATATWTEELDTGSRHMVRAMAACGEHMACSLSNMVQLWRCGDRWELVATHSWHDTTISVLVIWQAVYVASACHNGAICVFERDTHTVLCGVHTFSLLLHLVAYKDKLLSLQQTGHLLEWKLTVDQRLQRMRTVCLTGSSLLISGHRLISASYTKLRVLHAETLKHEVTLASPGTLRPMLATRTAVVGIMVNAEMYSNLVVWR